LETERRGLFWSWAGGIPRKIKKNEKESWNKKRIGGQVIKCAGVDINL
jgi:hypothetical protein